MSHFWGYAGADILAVATISVLSALCLVCAVLFIKDY